MLKNLFCFSITICCLQLNAQYVIKKTNWNDAGYKGNKPVYNQTVNIMNFGGNNTNSAANNIALNNAIAALNNKGGVVFFPKGVYSFTGQVSVGRDSITFKGAGYDSTQLRFNLNGVLNNCINVFGSQINADTTSFVNSGIRDSSSVNVINTSTFTVGDWVYLQCTDNSFMASSWAYGSLGQILQIKSIVGNKVTFNSPFRFYYSKSLQPKIKKLIPKKAIGFECMAINRLDATTQQASLITFDRAVQCWVHGVEGDSTNYAHIELSRCSNIDVTNSYFHHAFSYGGNGRAYGIALQYSSNECKIENNIFQNLRHSVLFQAGANGNVCGYNYSFNPFWSQFPFPNNSAGDIVLHGNYPFSNLIEGNINQNTVIDNSHAKNGPFNTFLRNRSESYGILMNSSPATDSTQLLGFEITNATLGLYTIVGNGNVTFGNNVNGTLNPANTSNLVDTSLYYNGNKRPNCFNANLHSWPILGTPRPYNVGSNAAKDRAMLNKWALCNCVQIITDVKNELNDASAVRTFPNPVADKLLINAKEKISEVSIYSLDGRLILSIKEKDVKEVNTESLTKGVYLIGLKSKNGIVTKKFVKE